jgi:hypothetical protein
MGKWKISSSLRSMQQRYLAIKRIGARHQSPAELHENLRQLATEISVALRDALKERKVTSEHAPRQVSRFATNVRDDLYICK